MKILLTGFEPFNHALTNSSELVVREIAKMNFEFQLTTCILPVVYAEAFSILKSRVEDCLPSAVISLGQAEGRSAISLERQAMNKDDAPLADNKGEVRRDAVIDDVAPSILPTRLPITEIYSVLEDQGVPVEFSDSAGNFLCNNLFFHSQHRFSSITSGFIHLPLVDAQAREFPDKPFLPLAEVVRGIEITLKTTASLIQRAT